MQMGVSLVSNIVDYACLSHREKELFSYVLEGYPSKVIAQHLGVTEALARVQLERFLRKIRVENRFIRHRVRLPREDVPTFALKK
jgi:DNA-binding CsgD family transcriptional regulator